MSLNATDQLTQKKFRLLDLAKTLKNLSEVCCLKNPSRRMDSKHKHRFQAQGIKGLKAFWPIQQSHRHTISPQLVERMLALSIAGPAWGYHKNSDELKLKDQYACAAP
jgi:hypothetical protein